MNRPTNELTSFEEQLAELLRRADDPYYRLMNALSEALSIMQDGQRRATDDAAQHILTALRGPQVADTQRHDEIERRRANGAVH